jgi:hypothetical protein
VCLYGKIIGHLEPQYNTDISIIYLENGPNLHLNLCFKAYKCGLFTRISKKCGTAMLRLIFCRKKGEKLDLTNFIRPVGHSVRPAQDPPNHTEVPTAEALILQDKTQSVRPVPDLVRPVGR